MRNRLWAVVGFSIGLLGLNGYLLQQEEENYFRHMDVQKEEAEVLLSTNTDPLMDTYQTRSANREQDYRAWGLDEPLGDTWAIKSQKTRSGHVNL